MEWNKRNLAWGKAQKQEIRQPPTESMLTLALIEQEKEEDEEAEEDGKGKLPIARDEGFEGFQRRLAQKFRGQPLVEKKVREKEKQPLTKDRAKRICLIIPGEPEVLTIPLV